MRSRTAYVKETASDAKAVVRSTYRCKSITLSRSTVAEAIIPLILSRYAKGAIANGTHT